MPKTTESFIHMLCLIAEKYYLIQADAKSIDILRELMLANGTPQAKIAELFRSSGATCDVLNAQRPITNTEARISGNFYHIDPVLFSHNSAAIAPSSFAKPDKKFEPDPIDSIYQGCPIVPVQGAVRASAR